MFHFLNQGFYNIEVRTCRGFRRDAEAALTSVKLSIYCGGFKTRFFNTLFKNSICPFSLYFQNILPNLFNHINICVSAETHFRFNRVRW